MSHERNGQHRPSQEKPKKSWPEHSRRCSKDDEDSCCQNCWEFWHSPPRKGKPDAFGHRDSETQKPISPERFTPSGKCASESSESSESESIGETPSAPEYVRAVFEAAKAKSMPAAASKYYLPKLKLLVALCAELQIAAGAATFFLACRDAGDLIGEDFRIVSNWLIRLEHDGVLRRISTGSLATHRANEYRYLGRDRKESD